MEMFSSAQIEHGDIVDGSLYESSKTQIRTGIWDDNPLLRAIAGTLWERIGCVVYECDPADPFGTKRVVFRGQVRGIQRRSGSLSASVESFGALMSRKVPRTLMQPRDNFALFEDGNDLDPADWTFEADATAQSGEVITLASLTWPGGTLPTIAAEYFALGYAIRPSPNYARIPIVSSTAESGGGLTVTLAYAPSPAITSTETGWEIIPGYDGVFDTAEDKFSNGDHFGGFPRVPIATPNLVAVKRNTGNSGKK